MDYGTRNEYAPLRRVLMHRPNPDDLHWVKQSTLGYYNFTACVDAQRYLLEYDQLLQKLAGQGTDIVLLTEVLGGYEEALAYISRRPNLVFTRDMATVYCEGAVLMNPRLKGRQWDGWVIRKCLEALDIPILGTINYPGYLEGGGNLLLGNGIGAVGLCDRTNEHAIEQLAAITLGRCLDELIVVNLPSGTIHLDSLLLVADQDLICLNRAQLEAAPTRILRTGQRVRYVWLPEYLEQRGFTCLDGNDEIAMSHLAVRPRCLVGYAHSQENVPDLTRYGATFMGVSGQELVKGDGGVHCMTCPLLRD